MVCQQSRKDRGLSLVELVIAMGILAIALTGVIAALLQAAQSNQANRELIVARDAVMAKLDELRARPVNQALGVYLQANSSFAIPGLPQSQGLVTFSPANPWPVDSAAPYLVELHVKATWSGVRGPSHYEN